MQWDSFHKCTKNLVKLRKKPKLGICKKNVEADRCYCYDIALVQLLSGVVGIPECAVAIRDLQLRTGRETSLICRCC